MSQTVCALLSNIEFSYKYILRRLISHHTGRNFDDVILNYNTILADDLIHKILIDYKNFLQKNKPIEYILGYGEFLGRRFLLTSDTLIPRPETEYLVITANKRIASTNFSYPFCLYDIGTGSGVLGISTFLENSSRIQSVIMTDVSPACLHVAEKNVKNLISESNQQCFHFFCSDLLSFLTGEENVCYIHIFVVNLPYIPNQTFFTSCERSVLLWEPHLALLGGDDGLFLYRRFLTQWQEWQKKGQYQTFLFCEMMTWQADILVKEFADCEWQIIGTFHPNISILCAETRE